MSLPLQGFPNDYGGNRFAPPPHKSRYTRPLSPPSKRGTLYKHGKRGINLISILQKEYTNQINCPDGAAVFGRSSTAPDRRVGGAQTPVRAPFWKSGGVEIHYEISTSPDPIVEIIIRNYCDKRRLIPLPEAPDTKGEPPHTRGAMYLSMGRFF